MSDTGASAGLTSPGLDPVGDGIASRLEARAWSAPAQRGVADVALDPVSRATERLRDDSDLPGASSGRAGMLARLLDQSAVGLPTWDLWGDRHGAPVLRVLGASYVLSPDGWVWVRREDDAPQSLPQPRIAGRPAPVGRRTRPPAQASVVRPASAPPRALSAPLEDASPADDVQLELPAEVRVDDAPAVAGMKPRGPARRSAAVRRVGPRVLSARLARTAAFARRLAPAPGAADGALAHEDRSEPRLSTTEPAAFAPSVPVLPRLRARSDLPEPTLLRAAAAAPTVAAGAAPARGRRPSVRAPGAAIVRRAAARQQGLPRAPVAAAPRGPALAQVAARTERPVVGDAVARAPAVSAPLATLAAATAASVPTEAGAPAPIRRPGRDVTSTPAESPHTARAMGSSSTPSPWARALGRVDAVVPADARTSTVPLAASPAVRLVGRVDAPAVAPDTLAPPPLSWVVPPRAVPASSDDASPSVVRRARRAAAHAEARAASVSEAPPVAGPQPVAQDAAADEAPDVFRAAVRARHRALGPVWKAARRVRASGLAAPGTVLPASIPGEARPEGVDADVDLPRTSAPLRRRARASARSVARAELGPDLGGGPVDVAPELSGLAADAPALQLLAAAGAVGAPAQDAVVASPDRASALAAAAAGARPTRLRAPLAVWQRVLARAPQQALNALASDPASAARVVEAMRKMRTLPEDAATPLRATVRTPTEAPAEAQRARRDKTRAALSSLRGGARSRAGAAGATRVTRLAQKLEGLVHLVESERRQAEAQRYVRRSAEPAAAPSAVGPARAGGDVSLESLQREVLEAVLRELERRRDRGQGVSDDIDG